MITDFTKEHPDRTLWRFWIPMMFSVMFQQIYNIADSMTQENSLVRMRLQL